MSEDNTPSPLAFAAQGTATCEEKLRACEVQLMLNRNNEQQTTNNRLIREQAEKDLKVAQARIKALENEVRVLREQDARANHVMEEVYSLTEQLDFKVETKRLKYIVLNNDICYLRFDRNGDIVKAFAPEEYERAQAQEWEEINNQSKQD